MKRIIITLCVLAALTVSACAMEVPAILPESVTERDGGRLEKVYRLGPEDDPAEIPTEDFEQNGRSYYLLDMTRQEENSTDAKLYTETITLESDTNDPGEILKRLDLQREAVTQDGYTGKLTLDTASIAVEATDYKTSSYTVTASRSYPSLSDADLSLVPKTIQENGRTLMLSNVEWTHNSTFYTANATYVGSASSRSATGYTVAANYIGQVSKTTCDAVIYTAIFGSTELPQEEIELPPPVVEPEPAVEENSSFGRLLLAIGGIITVAAVGMFGLYKFQTRRKKH